MNICDAINSRSLLSFSYHGHFRIVQPHTYGTDRNGHKALLAYQTGGTSSSGSIPVWRLFHATEMRALTVLKEQFSVPHHEYSRSDKAFSTIQCQL
jgi:hypothetical protein